MSTVGSPIDTSLLQTVTAQKSASKAKDKDKADTERTRRLLDQVELRVAGVESNNAVRKLPHNESQQAGVEHERQTARKKPSAHDDGSERPSIDVTA